MASVFYQVHFLLLQSPFVFEYSEVRSRHESCSRSIHSFVFFLLLKPIAKVLLGGRPLPQEPIFYIAIGLGDTSKTLAFLALNFINKPVLLLTPAGVVDQWFVEDQRGLDP